MNQNYLTDWRPVCILSVFLCVVFQAHADHFDLVSRRMGFIPLPLGSLVSNAVSFTVTVVTVAK